MLKRPIAESDVLDRQALRDLIAECAATPTRRTSSVRTGAAYLQSDVSEFHDGLVIPGTRYRVVSLLGAGGMGNVYDVEHVELGKRFVLKALHRGLCARDELVTRLRTEWRALGRLEHPNIVAVTDAGRTELGLSYFVMERLEGETLQMRLRREGRLRVPEALRIAEGLFEALSAAHAIGIVHRDIKPPNLFLTRDGGIKLLDFGIAKITDESAAAITQRGVAVGTPRYMSPEQARGERVDGRADLYAAGLLLFEMIIGQGPYDDRQRDANELLIAQLTETPPRLSSIAPNVSSAVDAFVAQLLEKDWRLRPATAREAAESARELCSRYGFGPDTREVTAAAGYDDPTRASMAPKVVSSRPRGLPTLRQIDDGQRDITTVVRAAPRESVTTGVLGTPRNGAVAAVDRRDVTLLDATRKDPSWISEGSAVSPIFETLVDPTSPTRTADVESGDLSEHSARLRGSAPPSSGMVTRADGLAARASHPDAYEVRVTTATPPPVAASAGPAPQPLAPRPRGVARSVAIGSLAIAAGGMVTWALLGAGSGADAPDATPPRPVVAAAPPSPAHEPLRSVIAASASAAPTVPRAPEPTAVAPLLSAVPKARGPASAMPQPTVQEPQATVHQPAPRAPAPRKSMLPASGL